MKSPRYLCLLMLASLAACSSVPRQPAPIIAGSPGLAPGQIGAPTENAYGYYTVKKGDNLYRIALEHGQNYHDLEAWNKLQNSGDIKVGQVLRVLPPGQTAPGAQAPAPVAQAESVTTGTIVEKRMDVGTSASSNGVVTTPSGNKVPYSDAKLAEMKQAAAPAAASAQPATTPEAAKPAVDAAINWKWPTDGKVLANFEQTRNKGIDIAGKPGQPVLAAAAGKVMYAGSGISGYGNLVIIQHATGWLSVYANNKTILVKEKQNVEQGQKIAEVGSTESDGVKLHFEIRLQGKPVDPLKYLPPR